MRDLILAGAQEAAAFRPYGEERMERMRRLRLIADLISVALVGCGALTAAKILGETAGVRRFRSRAAFARHNGTAPIPVWSGNNDRHRLNRGGNRQLNAATYRIAVTQLQRPGPARDYLERRLAGGNTKTEALRALRRHISDEIYKRALIDEQARTAAEQSLATAA